MSRKMKKFLKNVEAKSIPYVILVLLIGVALTSFFLTPQSPLSMSPASAAVGDFLYHKLITIDHSQVPSTQTDFPVLAVSTSNDFKSTANGGYLQADADDIEFWSFDNNTEYPYEIEDYDATTGKITIWMKVSSVSDVSDTNLWMYYGNSTCSANENPTAVWNSDYVMVQHMTGAAYTDLDDSTSNNHDVSAEGGTPTYNAVGKAGKCVTFVKTSSEYLTIPDSQNLHPYLPDWTFACWFKTGSVSADCFLSGGNPGTGHWYAEEILPDGRIQQAYDDNVASFVANSASSYDDGNWHYYSSVRDNSSDKAFLYIDGIKVDESADAGNNIVINLNAAIGASQGAAILEHFWNGEIDEVRISKTDRSADWINTAYNNVNNQSTFLTFGAQSGGDSSYELKGLTSGRVTWNGVAGNSVYCNSSGTANEWPEIYMTMNATTNITDLRVWMDDLNDTSAYVNASNITMYVSSDNSSYGELGTFPDGGGNCTYAINATNWNAGTMGADPFAGAGLTNKTASIWVIFKVAFPADTPTDGFWSGASNSFKIDIGHYS